jgi:hypothetical protein
MYDGYYNTSPACWSIYTEVLAEEYSNAVLFGQVHQLTVDAYAVQHAGDGHPDKSVGIHLAGLHLALEGGVRPPDVPALLQRLAQSIERWPHFEPPTLSDDVPTVFDVALAEDMNAHIERSRHWAQRVWAAWAPHHDAVADWVAQHLGD